MNFHTVPHIRLYQQWLQQEHGLRFESYESLRRWSVTDLEAFWESIWQYQQIQSPTPYESVLALDRMPGAQWFPGAQVNYAKQVLRHAAPAHAAGVAAIISENELGHIREITWPQLRQQVASLALQLREMGVGQGDRVAAYLPNVPETVIAFLACASIGAIWSVCAPDMGAQAVLDRFRQIEPRVLIAVNGVYYGGRASDRSTVVSALRDALPSVEKLIVVETAFGASLESDVSFHDAVANINSDTQAFEPEWVAFDHPLWIVYSSGTTGLPKPIVHGHGGILLTMLAAMNLHNDLGRSYEANNFGERFHWYSSTGWVMWNAQVAGLATGTTICIFDGNPGGSKDKPDWGVLWRFAARHRVSFLGAGAAFYANCMKAGIELSDYGDLSRIRALGCTGSPLPEDVQRWGTAQFNKLGTHDIWWCNFSGGTDFCGSFIGGNRELPQVPGKMQCRQLGCAVEAWNDDGQAVIGEVGELVCIRPIPSMPLYLWGDTGNQRYLSSYFDTYPGIWRHGDWLRIDQDGSCVILGRSDATINRHGLRMGTSEIYAAVEAIPQVLDSMIVDLEFLGRESWMALFVVLSEEAVLDQDMRMTIVDAIRSNVSPRFVPDEIFHVEEIPRTLSGKKLEIPVKRLLLGQPVESVIKIEAIANPQSLKWYVRLAQTLAEPHRSSFLVSKRPDPYG